VVLLLATALAAPGVAAQPGPSGQPGPAAQSDPITRAGPAAGPPAVDVPAAAATDCAAAGGSADARTDGPSDVTVDSFAAPGGAYDRLDDAGAIAAARADGTVTPVEDGPARGEDHPAVAYRDVVVHRVVLEGDATGLLDRLTDGEDGPPTDTFRSLAASDAIAVEYTGTFLCVRDRLRLNASIDRGAVRVVPDRANRTAYLVLDVDRLTFRDAGGNNPASERHVTGPHDLSLTLRESSEFAARNVTASSEYEVVEAEVAFAGRHAGLVRLPADGNRTVHGRTSLAPGSRLGVRLHPLTADASTVATTATANRTGAFGARFDRAALPEGAYAVSVAGVTDPPAVEAGASLVAVGNASTALVAVSDEVTDGTTLYGPTVSTTDGGFVVVRGPDGERRGASEYVAPGATATRLELSPPLETNGTITATVYRDADGDRAFDADTDVPYHTNGSVVRDSAFVHLDRDPTPAPTASPTPADRNDQETGRESTGTEGTSGNTTTTAPPPGTTTGPAESVPLRGFGLPAAALAVALLGLVQIRRLRRDPR
jgi:hypothetical protein